MQSAYSMFGSRLHLILDDEIADRYNRFVEAFAHAQLSHVAATGVPWNPETALNIDATDEEFDAFNAVGGLMNQLIEINGGSLDISEEEMTTDTLVKL